MLLRGGIAPHFLQLIKLSGLRQEYVNNDVHEIHNDPLVGAITFVVIRDLAAFLPNGFPHVIGNGLDLRGGSRFTDDEEIRYGFGYLTQVHGDQMLSLLIMNGLNDDL